MRRDRMVKAARFAAGAAAAPAPVEATARVPALAG